MSGEPRLQKVCAVSATTGAESSRLRRIAVFAVPVTVRSRDLHDNQLYRGTFVGIGLKEKKHQKSTIDVFSPYALFGRGFRQKAIHLTVHLTHSFVRGLCLLTLRIQRQVVAKRTKEKTMRQTARRLAGVLPAQRCRCYVGEPAAANSPNHPLGRHRSSHSMSVTGRFCTGGFTVVCFFFGKRSNVL